MIKINNVLMPTPTTYNVSIQDISITNTNARGGLIIEKIADKVNISMSWGFLAPADHTALLQALNGVYELEYLDPRTGNKSTASFYTAVKNTGVYSYVNETPVWINITIVAQEV